MKKALILALTTLLAAAMLFSACDLLTEPFANETETDSSILIAPEKTEPVTEKVLTPEEEALVQIAAEALWAEYDLPAREHFSVDIYPHATDGSNRVEFTLCIGGYRTHEDYSIRVSAAGTVTDVSGGYHNYRQFVESATPEKIAAAEAALSAQLTAYGEEHSGGHLTINDEGWLCLSREIIVELETKFWQQDGGCGVDHDHVFIIERICRPD